MITRKSFDLKLGEIGKDNSVTHVSGDAEVELGSWLDGSWSVRFGSVEGRAMLLDAAMLIMLAKRIGCWESIVEAVTEGGDRGDADV